MADTLVLGTSAARRESSNLSSRTKNNAAVVQGMGNALLKRLMLVRIQPAVPRFRMIYSN